MQLLTDELRQELPPLYAQKNDNDPIVYVKFFTPDSNWTWYATEGEQQDDDFIFFGYVIGQESEWGYFSLNELSAARRPLRLPIERDLYFSPKRVSEIKELAQAL